MCHLFYNVDCLFLVLYSYLYQTKLKNIVLSYCGVLHVTEIVSLYIYIYIYMCLCVCVCVIETGNVPEGFKLFSCAPKLQTAPQVCSDFTHN